MTADELAVFNGLVAAEVTARKAQSNDGRPNEAVVDDILREINAPSLARFSHSISRMLTWRATRIG